MKNYKKTIIWAMLIGTGLVAKNASAFTANATCNGVVTWSHIASINNDTCNIPTGGTIFNALFSDWSNWSANTTSNLGTITGRNFGCTWTSGDGNNQIELVTQASLGSGINAVTLSRWGTCFFSHGTYTEADILTSNALSYTPEDESFFNWSNTVQGPVVMAHETGHFLGLGHSENFDIMRASTPEPVAGGNQAEPYPDDANGGRWLYGNTIKTNVFASAQQDVGNVIMATNSSGTVNVCRGQNISVTFTVVNSGSIAVNSVGFRVAVTQTPDTGGVDIFDATATSPAGTSFTETHILTVPSVANGVYWIIWQGDTGNAIAETNESDNSVHSAMTINVVC